MTLQSVSTSSNYNRPSNMPAPFPNTQETKETAPAQPGKTFLVVLGLTCCFYLVDCMLVTFFQDHPNSPWIEWGIHAGGPAGFGATAIVFLIGVVSIGLEN